MRHDKRDNSWISSWIRFLFMIWSSQGGDLYWETRKINPAAAAWFRLFWSYLLYWFLFLLQINQIVLLPDRPSQRTLIVLGLFRRHQKRSSRRLSQQSPKHLLKATQAQATTLFSETLAISKTQPNIPMMRFQIQLRGIFTRYLKRLSTVWLPRRTTANIKLKCSISAKALLMILRSSQTSI